MKRRKFLLYLLVPTLLLSSCVVSENNTSSAPSEEEEVSEETPAFPTEPDANATLVWRPEYADVNAGLTSAEDVYLLKAYESGNAVTSPTDPTKDGDARYLFSGKEGAYTRVVVPAEGYCMTLPGVPEADYSIGKYRSQYKTDDYVLTVTYENQNPYGKQGNGHTSKDGYDLYLREWLVEQLEDTNFHAKNSLTCTTLKDTVVGDYTVTYYVIQIRLAKNIPMPYYQIAIVRPTDTYDYFYLLVMKSTARMDKELKEIVAGFSEVEKIGTPTNGITSYELKEDPNWSDETRAYFRSVVNRTDVGFGAFHQGNDATYTNWLWGEEALNTNPDLYMTYLHVGWYDTLTKFDKVFALADQFAGGDGTNGKPVFNLTYQFTLTNNATGGVKTPMFDILRGLLDNHFREFAAALKAYGKPVILRLNNEMNTDWTDYCGMMTLLDPDIFQETWRHMYKIFEEEGVDNCIWVFNPISKTCPYSNWGEALCYMPGEDYVQMLGITNYQMNNGTNGANPDSFKKMYKETAAKMLPYFDNYPWIIGEFACGSGGEAYYDYGQKKYINTTLDRNARQQANWVQGMVDCFEHNQEADYDFCKRIKLAVWFSANDYASVDGKNIITNKLNLNAANKDAIEILGKYLREHGQS